MKVQLRIAKGPNKGRLLTLGGREFVIGRAEDCHLRPNSESISRRHCTIHVAESEVSIEDLGSRNGSLVNGERVKGTQVLRNGDQLQIGPLAFQVVLASGSPEKVATKRVDAGAPTSSANDTELGTRTSSAGQMADSVADWLDEAPTDSDQAKNETKVLNLDDTNSLPVRRDCERDLERSPETGRTEIRKARRR